MAARSNRSAVMDMLHQIIPSVQVIFFPQHRGNITAAALRYLEYAYGAIAAQERARSLSIKRSTTSSITSSSSDDEEDSSSSFGDSYTLEDFRRNLGDLFRSNGRGTRPVVGVADLVNRFSDVLDEGSILQGDSWTIINSSTGQITQQLADVEFYNRESAVYSYLLEGLMVGDSLYQRDTYHVGIGDVSLIPIYDSYFITRQHYSINDRYTITLTTDDTLVQKSYSFDNAEFLQGVMSISRTVGVEQPWSSLTLNGIPAGIMR